MDIAYVVTAVLLSVVLIGSGTAKLRRVPQVVEGLGKANVPDSWFPPLALVEFAGAAGLLIGIGVRPLGLAAAVGVVLYFVGAVGAHLRAGDRAGVGTPAGVLVLAVATLVFAALTV